MWKVIRSTLTRRLRNWRGQWTQKKQYSRRNCLLLHSIAEGERENTDDLVLETLNEKVHVDLTLSDLDRTYRIGQKKASSNKPRAIIIRFVSYNTRKRICLSKKLLKRTQVSIRERLTVKRTWMVKRCTKMETTIKLNFNYD